MTDNGKLATERLVYTSVRIIHTSGKLVRLDSVTNGRCTTHLIEIRKLIFKCYCSCRSGILYEVSPTRTREQQQ